MAHDASSITSGSVRAMPFNTPTRPPPSARVRPNSTSGSGLRGNRSMSRASTRSARSTATVTEELYKQLATEADIMSNKVELEKRQVTQLSQELGKMEQRIDEQRRIVAAMNSSSHTPQHMKRKVAVMDRAVEKSKTRVNTAKEVNNKLRNRINELRRQRVSLLQVLRKLEREFNDKKARMARIIADSQHANHMLGKAQAQMHRVEITSEREAQRFAQEWQKLGKDIEQEKHAKPKQAKRKRSKKGGAGAGEDTKAMVDNLTKGVKGLQTKNALSAWSFAKQKTNAQLTEKKLAAYESAFVKIQDITGVRNLEELVTSFVAAEERNYSLFRYATQLNTEVEKLHQGIAECETEINRLRSAGTDSDNKRKQMLDNLVDQVARKEAKAAEHNATNSKCQKSLNLIIVATKELFDLLQCDRASGADLLGESGIMPVTLMPHLGVIEQRIHEELQAYMDRLPRKARKQNELRVGVAPGAPPGGTKLHIPPPRLEDFEDDSTGEQRPLTRVQLAGMLRATAPLMKVQ